MKKILLWAPFILFVSLMGIFALGLINPSDRVIASGMVGRQIPGFSMAGLKTGEPPVVSSQFADGKARLLNIFGSWCKPCIAEAPQLMMLKAQGAEIIGIAINDTPEKLAPFLVENGNPYLRIGLDPNSRTQIDFGSAGVPETFVVDGKGKITHQHIGIITEDDVPILMAKLRGAQ